MTKPHLNDDFRDMLGSLSRSGVEYLVVDGYAVAAHGWPRATKDIDLWVRRSPENAVRVLRALAAFGVPVANLTTADLMRRDMVISVGVPPRRVDILTSIDGVEFEDAWPRRVDLVIDGVGIPVIGRGDLLTHKQSVGRRQDLADIEALEGRAPANDAE